MMKGTGQIHPDRPYLIKSYDSNFIAKGANKLEWDLDDRHTEQDIEDFMEYMKSEYGWANPKFHRFGNVLMLDTHGKDFDITEYREFPFQKWSLETSTRNSACLLVRRCIASLQAAVRKAIG